GDCTAPCEKDVASYIRDYPHLTRLGWVGHDFDKVAVFHRLPGQDSEVEAEARDVAVMLAQRMTDRASSRRAFDAIVLDTALPELVLALRRSPAGPLLLATVDPARLLRSLPR